MPSGESEPLLDYATLFNAGLRFTQTLAADHWTDYNLHDPGVTILQQLCYALTDLAYRARWPVEDLLAQPPKALPGAGPAESLQSTLFDGPHILTCAPVTAHDYRTLLYAQVEALENAWFRASDDPRGIQGLYDVDVQLYQPFEGSVEKPRGDVRALYLRTRPLCEDIAEIRILTPGPVTIAAEIDIDSSDTADDIAANIFSRLQSNLIPPPVYSSIWMMREAGRPYDEIFEGPAMIAVIDNATPDQPPRQLAVAEFAKIARGAAGVARIRRLELAMEGADQADSLASTLAWDAGVVPTIDIKETLRGRRDGAPQFLLRRGEVAQELDFDRVMSNIAHRQFMDHERVLSTTRTVSSDPYNRLPTGTFRSPGRYTSIRGQFPMVYGLGPYGAPRRFLPGDSRIARRTEARGLKVRQLEDYLMIFEQVMANHLAQLANIPALFALDERAGAATYFWQAVDPDGGAGRAGGRGEAGPADFRESLCALVAQEDPVLERRQRLLDHLLARFNESFDDDRLDRAWDAASRTAADVAAMKRARNAAKAAFLCDYLFVSAFRGAGIDYSFDPPPPTAGGAAAPDAGQRAYNSESIDPYLQNAPVTGLERRVKLLAQIPELHVVEHILLRNRGDVLDRELSDFYSLKLTVVVPGDSIGGQPAVRPLVMRTIEDNCPAHIEALCIFPDGARMDEFRAAHAAWRSAYAAAFARPAAADIAELDRRSAAVRNLLRAYWRTPPA